MAVELRRRASVIAVLAAIPCVSLGLAGSAHASYRGRNGAIAYELRNAHWVQTTPTGGIWAINPDGSNERPLITGNTPTGVGPITPAWSPDGQLIAYAGSGAIGHGIYFENLDGLPQGRTPGKRTVTNPTWSPNQNWIALDRSLKARREGIESVQLQGRGVLRLARSGVSRQPAYSPTNGRIAYSHQVTPPRGSAKPYFAICLMHFNGSHKHCITKGGVATSPDWSPNGKRIVYGAVRGVVTMRPDGSHARTIVRLPRTVSPSSAPVYSPNGKRIAFQGAFRGATPGGDVGAPLETVKADGSDLRQLTDPSEGEVFDPTWRPIP